MSSSTTESDDRTYVTEGAGTRGGGFLPLLNDPRKLDLGARPLFVSGLEGTLDPDLLLLIVSVRLCSPAVVAVVGEPCVCGSKAKSGG